MAKPINIPNVFAAATSAIPLSQLDQDFSTLANATNDLATYSNYVADTGAANAFIANYPVNTNTGSLTTGLRLQFKAANANSGASTLNVQVNGASIGTASIRLTDGSALPANTIIAGAMVDVMYDGTNFQLMNDPSGGQEVITNLTLSGNLTVTGTSNFTGNVTANVANTTTSTITNLSSGNVTITGGTISNVTLDNVTVDVETFSNITINGTATFSAGTVSAPALTTTGDTNTGIYFPAADTIAFTEGGVESMRIDSSGNVGIGTSSISNRLDIYSTDSSNARVRIEGTTNFVTHQLVNTGGNFYFAIDNSTGSVLTGVAYGRALYSTDAYPIMIYTNGTERMRITSNGNVGIGGAPDGRLHVIDQTDRTETTAQFMVNGNGYTAFHWLNSTAYYIGQNSDARSLRIYSGSNENTGVNLGVGGTSWGTYSDERLKDIIEPITNGVEKLSNLRTVIGKYKTDSADKRRVFLIAQDVEKVLPEATYKDNEDTLFLQYQDLIPVLVKAIQEQQQIINDLKARIETLESK